MPNEYEVFFNKASESGVAAIRKLTPEERADRALEVCDYGGARAFSK